MVITSRPGWDGHQVEPIRVLRAAAVQGVVEGGLDLARDRPGHAFADRDVVDRRGLRRRRDHAVLYDEDVLATALADVALVVEENRLLVARLERLDLREHRVQVLAAGLG